MNLERLESCALAVQNLAQCNQRELVDTRLRDGPHAVALGCVEHPARRFKVALCVEEPFFRNAPVCSRCACSCCESDGKKSAEPRVPWIDQYLGLGRMEGIVGFVWRVRKSRACPTPATSPGRGGAR
jgi:hypothetical protein